MAIPTELEAQILKRLARLEERALLRLGLAAPFSITDGVWTPIAWSAELFDDAGLHAPSASVITLPLTGLYLLLCEVWFATSAAGSYRMVRFMVDGVALAGQAGKTSSPSGGDTEIVQGHGFVYAAAGQTADLEVFQNSGGALNARTESWMGAVYLGAAS